MAETESSITVEGALAAVLRARMPALKFDLYIPGCRTKAVEVRVEGSRAALNAQFGLLSLEIQAPVKPKRYTRHIEHHDTYDLYVEIERRYPDQVRAQFTLRAGFDPSHPLAIVAPGNLLAAGHEYVRLRDTPKAAVRHLRLASANAGFSPTAGSGVLRLAARDGVLELHK